MLLRNVSLKNYNTFGLDYKADRFISFTDDTELPALIENIDHTFPVLVLGGGSNLLFLSDFPGTILHPQTGNIDTLDINGDTVIISAEAGVNWDKLVEWCVERGFGGIENLSLIPGNVGAAPVQNIGAYGVEVREVIDRVVAFSIIDGNIREFTNEECRFGYRDSIFKGDLKGKYLITRVIFKLKLKPDLKLDYGSLHEEVRKLGTPSLKTVREAVISIRRSKLPDPSVTGNAGSFFRNPVISLEKGSELKTRYPGIPLYNDQSGGMKVAAGWLIEQCGWKGKSYGNAGVHEKQALVIVNRGMATGKEILDLSESIRNSVFEKFGIELQREVEIAGTI